MLGPDKHFSQTSLAVSSHGSTDKGMTISGGSCFCGPVQKRNPVGQPFCATASVGLGTYYEGFVEPHSVVSEDKVGVLLLNLGGPETLHDVQPFLFNLFADPVSHYPCFFFFRNYVSMLRFWHATYSLNVSIQDIIRLPRLFQFLQRPLAKLISVLRAPKSKEGYASIGGGSPLRKITDEQVECIFC